MKADMSTLAWDALVQLSVCPRHDSELISKSGRTELMQLGLAKRGQRCPQCQLLLNELTPAGAALAARVVSMPECSKEWRQ